MNRNTKLTRPKKEYRKGFKTTEMSALIESELQRLQIRICDVEGTLRFSQYDLKSWKENIVKCLKLFHLLIFIIEEQKNFRISCLLKRILGCVSVIFSRSSPSGVQIFRKQAKHLESPVSRCSVAASPNKPRHSMCNLGGVTTSDCLQRGLEIKSSDAMVLHQDSEDEIIHEEYPIQLKQLDIIRSMERDQYKVAQINNIEQQIDKYLLYLAQCEKSASKLLDTEIVSCGFELENAFSCINVQLENRKNGHFETSNKIKEIVRAYRRLFQQKHKVMTIQKSDQSVQANTFMPSEVRKTFSETPQSSPPSEIKSLNFSLAHYKEEILRLNKEASEQKADNDRYVQIINALYTQIMYTETINLRLQEKFNKLASIDFLQEIDFVIGNESPPEIRVKLANSLQTLIKKLGIDKSQTQSKKRVQLTLPHDIIKYGGVDRLLNHISNEIGSNKSIDGEKDIKSPRRKSQRQQTFFQDSPRKIIDETPEEKNATKKLTRKDINKPLKTLKNVINKTQVKNLYKSKKHVKISEENPHKLTEKADSSYFKSQKKLKKTIQSKKLLDKKQEKYQNEINIDQINKDLLKKQLLNIKFFEQEKLKNSTPILFQNSKQSHRVSDTKMQSPTNFNTRHLKSFQKLQQNHFSTRHLKPVQGIQDNPRKQLIPLVNIRQTQPISAVNLQENEELTSNSNIQNQQEDSVIYPSIKFALDRLESSKFVQTSNTNIEKNQIGDKTGKERQMILTRTFDFFVHPTKKSEHKSSFETSQFDKFDLNINKSDRQINEDQFQYAPERFVQTLSRFRKIERNLPRLTLDFSTKSRGSSVGNYFNQTGLVKGQTFSIQSKANQSLEPRTSLIVKPQSQKNQDVMIMQIISTHKKQEILTKIKELYPNNWLNFFCKDLAIRQMLGSLRRKKEISQNYLNKLKRFIIQCVDQRDVSTLKIFTLFYKKRLNGLSYILINPEIHQLIEHVHCLNLIIDEQLLKNQDLVISTKQIEKLTCFIRSILDNLFKSSIQYCQQFYMEVNNLLQVSKTAHQTTDERVILSDISNWPKLETVEPNQKTASEMKDQNNQDIDKDDYELLALVEQCLTNRSIFEKNEKVFSSDDDQFQLGDIPIDLFRETLKQNHANSDTNCSIVKTNIRTGHTRQSIFKRQKLNCSEIVTENINKIDSPSGLKTQFTSSQVIFRGKDTSFARTVLEVMSQMAKTNQFQIVRNSTKELLIRKRRTKSFIQEFLFCIREPQAFQLIIQSEICKASLYRVAGTLKQFQNWSIQLVGKLWEKGLLILTKQQQFRLFINRQQTNFQNLKSKISTSLKIQFRKVMNFRNDMKIKMLRLQLGEKNYVNILDKFILDQSGLLLSYKRHYKLLQTSYRQKRKKINSNITIAACLQYLQVQQIHQLLAVTQINNYGQPYEQAMKQLSRLDSEGSFEQKLECLVKCYKFVKDCCNKYHSGRVILQKMDNMLPIIIYIVLYTEALDLIPNLAMIQHFIQYKQSESVDYELQRRMLTNLNVALEYIITSWDFSKMS